LPERAQAYARITFGKAIDGYDDLANRGKSVVGRVRRQEATEESAEHAGRAGRKTQPSRTAARKGAVRATRSPGKATETEAKKTAAAKASAEKVGD